MLSMASSLLSAPEEPTEARKLVQSAIVTVLDKQEFSTKSTRAVTVQNLGKHLLQLPENNATYNNFCDYLVGTLRRNFQRVGRFRSSATKREYLWRAFHKQSVEELPSSWKGLYCSLGILDMAESLSPNCERCSV